MLLVLLTTNVGRKLERYWAASGYKSRPSFTVSCNLVKSEIHTSKTNQIDNTRIRINILINKLL